MNRALVSKIVCDTFTQSFDKGRFLDFTRNLLNHIDESESRTFLRTTQYIKDAFKPHVQRFERLGTYTSPAKEKLDVLVVHLTQESKLERARTAIRNFVADHLKTRDEKDAALVAFVSPSEATWRFSYVKMEYVTEKKESGKVGVEERLTPARRFSYIVGEGESCHTAQARFLDLLQDTETDPALADIEEAFSVEAVTKEFYQEYKKLYDRMHDALDELAKKEKAIHDEFEAKGVNTVDFAKKLMGQIVFLYFLQKKGWLGVEKDKDWGTGPHNFLRRLADKRYGEYDNFFNDVLEPLFYDTLATDRGHDAWCNRFKCRIPFLNGGLFEPLGDYNWRKTDISLPNKLFLNSEFFEEGITGTGVLDVFDRYNFTVNEAEPLEKEVAIDPEMLGKVFENLIEENRRKGLGSYYTPREIVHYMCQESLINYLDTAVNKDTKNVPRENIEEFIHLGEQYSFYEAAKTAGTKGKDYPEPPQSIRDHARLIDDKLAEITVCDPAVGSGAFPVGMMHEIIHARLALTPYFNDVGERTPYHFKRHAIQNCLYGVDIDPGAVEIAKLRLWLSLVVDEEDVKQIKPLPNLDYKIVGGNSLLGVEKTVFNERFFRRLEELKPKYFDEADADKKHVYKHEIDGLIDKLTNGKRTFDFEIYFSEVFHKRKGFDVVIANPPYGFRNVLTPEEKVYFRKQRGIQFPSGDVAELFIIFSLSKLTRPRGTLTFIIPKKSLYGESWINVRKLWLGNFLCFLMDASQAFENVLLEQVAFSVQKTEKTPQQKIAVGWLNSEKHAVEVFGAFDLPDIFTDDFRNAQIYKGLFPKPLLHKIKQHGIENTSTLLRGEIGISNITPHLTFEAEDNFPCVKGIDIVRYGLKPDIRYLKRSAAKRFIDDYPQEEKLIAQEIIAHIQNPQPHILITMFLDDQKRLLNDTCVEITVLDKRLNPKFVMAYFHSTFANWYAYNFVYNRAIRTMHFINYYITQIPLPKAVLDDPATQELVSVLVDRILAVKKKNPEADTTVLEREIDQLVYKLYDLTPEEIAIVEGKSS
jgi:type I restriction-modification system DNA methylase subunit